MNSTGRHIQSTMIHRMLMGRSLSKSDPRVPEQIHINELSRRYRDPATWFDGGLHCFDLARQAQSQLGNGATLVLRYSIRDGRRKRGPFIRSVKQLAQLFDLAPPEVCCVWQHRGHFIPTRTNSTSLDLHSPDLTGLIAFLTEWKPPRSRAIVRTVWLREIPQQSRAG